MPLPLEGDLVHVDVDSGDVFIAALDAVVLEVTMDSEPKMAPGLPGSGSDSFLPLDLGTGWDIIWQSGVGWGLHMLLKSQSVDFGLINREVILAGQL